MIRKVVLLPARWWRCVARLLATRDHPDAQPDFTQSRGDRRMRRSSNRLSTWSWSHEWTCVTGGKTLSGDDPRCRKPRWVRPPCPTNTHDRFVGKPKRPNTHCSFTAPKVLCILRFGRTPIEDSSQQRTQTRFSQPVLVRSSSLVIDCPP